MAILGPALLLSMLAKQTRRRRGAWLGFLFGLGFFGTLLNWTMDLGALAWVALVFAQSAFLAAFGFLTVGSTWSRAGTRPSVPSAVRVGLAWAGIELVRAGFPLGGFSWGGLGYPFVDVPLAKDLAAIGGGHFIAAVAMTIAALIARGSVREASPSGRDRSLMWASGSIAALLLVAPLAPRPKAAGSLDIAVIQGNVPREQFDNGIGRRGRVGPEDVTIVENHLEVTEQLLTPDGFPPDLVVWPENAFDRDPDEYPELAEPTQALIDAIGSPFIIGAIVNDGELSYNASLLWEPDLGIDPETRYEKQHLVPFGEYVPWGWPRRFIQQLAEQVPEDLAPGRGPSIIEIDGVPIGTVICFESSVARDVRRPIDEGAQVILVTTNNASFGTSPVSAQHVQTSQMRALENRISVVHAAISGKSGFIDEEGNVRQRTRLFEARLIREEVALVKGKTIFGMIGAEAEGAAALFALVMLLGAMLPGRLKATPGEKKPRPPLGRVLVAIPTFNEALTIESTVADVRAALPGAAILIIDDGSPDGTGDIADRLADQDPQIEVIHREAKAGLASAYLAAFQRCVDTGAGAVIEMDADGSHDARDLPRLVASAANADLVIGSRYVSGGYIEGWSLWRRALSRLGNVYSKMWLGLGVRDSTAGFRLYRRPLLVETRFEQVTSDGYGFQVEMTLRALRAGAKVVEVPIVFHERRAGTSKMSRSIILEALWRIPWLASTREKARQEEP